MLETDIDKKYDEFWRDIVENPEGGINKEQLKKELFDFSILISNVNEVYSHVTGGNASKPMTCPEVIISLSDDRMEDNTNFIMIDYIEFLRDKFVAELELDDKKIAEKLAVLFDETIEGLRVK
jgi:hypothetical protein